MDFSRTPLPPGIEVFQEPNSDYTINYRGARRSALDVLLTDRVALWPAISAFLTYKAFPFSGFAVTTGCLAMWVITILIVRNGVWSIGARSTFSLLPDRLVVERRLWFFTCTRSFLHPGIVDLRQYPAADAPNHQRSWNLEIRGAACGRIFEDESRECCTWFGDVLSQWAQVPFRTAATPYE
jgi:hypothetical protein